jgi:hypothetical protein
MTEAQGFTLVVSAGVILTVRMRISLVVKWPRNLGHFTLAGSTIELISYRRLLTCSRSCLGFSQSNSDLRMFGMTKPEPAQDVTYFLDFLDLASCTPNLSSEDDIQMSSSIF